MSSGDDQVATITLNRPEQLNAFNRTMCEEMAEAWRIVKADDSVNAVVLRAAGDRAFSAGLDIKTPYGQPQNIWNHEDPGEALSPKWQKMWKPVVCAVQGMCTAGAFYFVNESDVVICSSDATFFDSHVSAGLVCALEPIGLMRRVGLGETLRIALMGNDERVSADTALRIGLVSEVVAARGPVDTRARDRRCHCRQTSVSDPGHRQSNLGVAGQTLPGSAGTRTHLHPARESDRHRRAGQARRSSGVGAENSMTAHRLSRRIDDVLRLEPDAQALEYERQWFSWKQLGAAAARVAAITGDERPQVGIMLRNRPTHVAALLGVLQRGATVVVINPARGDERIVADVDQLALPLLVGEPHDLAMLGEQPAATTVSITDLASDPNVIAASQVRADPEPARGRRADADQRDNRTAQTGRPQLRHAGAQRDGTRS